MAPRALIAACLALVSVSSAAAAGTHDAPAGQVTPALVTIGGELHNQQILREIVRLGGGPGRARIAVITAASNKAKENGKSWIEDFRKVGGDAHWLDITPKNPEAASSDAVLAQFHGSTVVVFGGGGQDHLLAAMRPHGQDSRLLAAIRQQYASGRLVIAGTSAGGAAQARGSMILGGESHDVLRLPPVQVHDGEADRETSDEQSPLRYSPDGGLGFFAWGTVDTHSDARSRGPRGMRHAAETGSRYAFNFGEDTAGVTLDPLGPAPSLHVIGTNGVEIYDLGEAEVSRRHGYAIRNVLGNLLTDGDSVDLSTGAIHIAPSKTALAAGGRSARARAGNKLLHDVFGSPRHLDAEGERQNPGAFLHVATALLESGERGVTARSFERHPVRVRFARTRRTRAYRAATGAVSYTNLSIHMGAAGGKYRPVFSQGSRPR